MTPYLQLDDVTLYHGDMRHIAPTLTADAVITDPPYGETALPWDRWPTDWPIIAALIVQTMWCFGTLRLFLRHRDQFQAAGWKLSQDLVWAKPRATNMRADRFARTHELIALWYRGPWTHQHTDPPRELWHGARVTSGISGGTMPHWNREPNQAWTDDGTRIHRTVIEAPSVRNGFPAEKPVRVLEPPIRYSTRPGDTILDPFAGSGSTADACRALGRTCILIEQDEMACERIARRLTQTAIGEIHDQLPS